MTRTQHDKSDSTGPELSRRRLLQTTAAAGGAAAFGAYGVREDHIEQPVQRGDAALPALVFAYPVATTLVGLAGGAALVNWLSDDSDLDELRSDLVELDDESAEVLIAEVARAVDAQESQYLIERENRFNFNVDVAGSATTVAEYGDSGTISYLDTAWSEVRAGAGAEFAAGGDAESAEPVAQGRARAVDLSAAVSTLENSNANFESLAYPFADQASRDAVDVLKIGDDTTEPEVASGRPAGTDVVASDYDNNDPVVISIPLEPAEDYTDPSGFSGVADDYDPVVLAVYDGTEWVPAVDISPLPLDYHDDVNTSNLASGTETVYAEHADALEETVHPHIGESFEAAATQLDEAATQLIDTDIEEFVNAAETQIEEGDLEPEDLIGARELVGRFSDTENFSRFAAELVGSGFRMPGDGSLGTQATVAHDDLSELTAGVDTTFGDSSIVEVTGDTVTVVGDGDVTFFDINDDGTVEETGTATITNGENPEASDSDDNGTVYVAVNDSDYNTAIAAIDPFAGEVVWQTDYVYNSPRRDGLVHVPDGNDAGEVMWTPSGESAVYAVDAGDGTETRNAVSVTSHHSSMDSGGGYVYAIDSGTSTTYVYDPDDLSNPDTLSSEELDEVNSVRYIDGTVWVGQSAVDGLPQLVAFDAGDGTETDAITIEDTAFAVRYIRRFDENHLLISSGDADRIDLVDIGAGERVEDSSITLTDVWKAEPVDGETYLVAGNDADLLGDAYAGLYTVGGSVTGDDEATGHVFIDTNAAVNIEEGEVVNATQYDTAYLITVEEGGDDHSAVLMDSDEGALEILEVHLDEATEDASEDAEGASDGEVDEEEGTGLDSEETPEDDEDDGTDTGTVTEDHYIEVPGDDATIEQLSDRGDVQVRVVDVATDDVLETRPASDIEQITVEGVEKWVLPTESAYTDVRLTYDAGFTLSQPVEGEQDPTDPDDIREQVEAVAEALQEIEEARQQAVNDAESDGPGAVGLIAGGGLGALILYFLFGDN